ncbi:hypothetical protein [uncultured Bacteroides sp.]|uniref:hypothetical protein n=1 Tax=uncultured Bacteroides sp. TaxID=162156 RepID=UPI0025D76A2A|nr:hypothetical protein [uncultured Bacteroides sp.]
MEKLELVPNVSVGMFVLGDNINRYLSLSHTVEHIDRGFYSYDDYEFPEQYVSMWVENQKIEFITCDTYCFWHNENLIGMSYDRFLLLIGGQQPDDEDVCYIPISKDRGQNQKVYDFENLGLQIWVWRNKIKTVIISKDILEDE